MVRYSARAESIKPGIFYRVSIGDGNLTVAEDPLGSGRVQSFGELRQHHPDLVRGGFQRIQGSVASGSERRVAGLAAKGLDALSLAMRAIPEKARGYEHL
jgi:hypothetical protein